MSIAPRGGGLVRAAVVAIVLAAFGCTWGPPHSPPYDGAFAPLCTLGVTTPCTCSNGAQGEQTCDALGSYGSCVCVLPPEGCSASQSLCDGVCVNAATDATNCGACGHACPGASACLGGACICTGPGLATCLSTCVDLANDNANCGACGVPCGMLQQCVSGVCVCGSRGGLCGGVCVDLSSNNNCGACGHVCDTLHSAGCFSEICFNLSEGGGTHDAGSQ